jgi:TldD protein
MISYLKEILAHVPADYAELRYHDRRVNAVAVRKGEPEAAQANHLAGVGVRLLDAGRWGFSSTPGSKRADIMRAIGDAATAAKAMSKRKKTLAKAKLAKGEFRPPVEAKARRSKKVVSASSAYIEYLDKKAIVTSDGAAALITDAKPEFRITVVAKEGTNMVTASEFAGVTGGWKDLWRYGAAEEIVEKAVKRAQRLLSAEFPKGGRMKVILSPEMVGLIAHEAIGHTVEADFVLSGAITKGKIGQRVASELITLADSGPSVHIQGASGTLLVDDEGVMTERTVIIENGILKSYLHNRESAASFGVAPTGNARAYEYSDEPIIRMRNTYIEPGKMSLAELLASTDRALLLEGAGGGQADANAEFMFGVQEATLIEKGKRKKTFRGVTISGNAFTAASSREQR